MARRGRNRKQVERTVSGQPSRAGKAPPWPAESIAKRAAWVGHDRARFEDGGRALSKLLAKQMITAAQAKAGLAYAKTHASWASLAAAPARYLVCADPPEQHSAPITEEEMEMRENFARLSARIERIHAEWAAQPACALVRGVVEMVTIENVLPLTWERPENVHPPTLAALRAGLDVLVAEYRMDAA